MFGSTASVLHYTWCCQIIASLANRPIGLPLAGYIDDFGTTWPSEVIDGSLFILAQLRERIGIFLKYPKSLEANEITRLGLLGGVPIAPTASIYAFRPTGGSGEMGRTNRRPRLPGVTSRATLSGG